MEAPLNAMVHWFGNMTVYFLCINYSGYKRMHSLLCINHGYGSLLGKVFPLDKLLSVLEIIFLDFLAGFIWL